MKKKHLASTAGAIAAMAALSLIVVSCGGDEDRSIDHTSMAATVCEDGCPGLPPWCTNGTTQACLDFCADGGCVVCHKGRKTKELPQEAVPAHLGHGDQLGPCPVDDDDADSDSDSDSDSDGDHKRRHRHRHGGANHCK